MGGVGVVGWGNEVGVFGRMALIIYSKTADGMGAAHVNLSCIRTSVQLSKVKGYEVSMRRPIVGYYSHWGGGPVIYICCTYIHVHYLLLL